MLQTKPQKNDGISTRSTPTPETPTPLKEQSSTRKSLDRPSVENSNPISQSVTSRCVPWVSAIAYPLARYLVLPLYFRRVEITGREHFPAKGPVIIAATHRSRWDAIMVPAAVGQDATGRALRFMVTADEVKGIQGWFIRQLGGFPIDTRHPTIAALRHSIELLQQGEALVIF
ncbi:MAG TPA: 1-acyl-sn-glycerol-3-phosphate acyltransferase, partial [Leptolyngbya sp.]|nr:1-acyl-sn-glycerol-3-phosphate acyltransferase [Leptolyngbya sp.]